MQLLRILPLVATASLAVATSPAIDNRAIAQQPNQQGGFATGPALAYTGVISTIDNSALPTSSKIIELTSSSTISPSIATGAASSALVQTSSKSTLSTPTSATQASAATTSTTPKASSTEPIKSAPNATSSKPADQAGGAVLPQMQGSMAGLLGFCIMSLIML